jgi:putative ABC transport system permease protein
MNSLKYIWRNVTRNKLRSSLTILSIGFSLALMTVLHGYMAMQSVWGNEAKKNNRIVVMNIQGFSGALPIATVEKVRGIDGVVSAVPYAWFGGNYQAEPAQFAQFGTDPMEALNVWPEFQVDPQQVKDWQNDRTGCLVDAELARQQKWKIGDIIRLEGTFYPINLELTVRGFFVGDQDTGTLWFNWKYMNEELKAHGGRGVDNSGTIFAKVASSDKIARVIEQIDDKFESSDNPTRTQTEAAFAQMFTDMLGNLQAYIRNIGLAVVFSLSLVAANAMAMAMRERTTEISVLKAIGFPKNRVLRMVLGEAIIISMCGGLLGIGLGCGFLESLHGLIPQMFPFSIIDMVGPWLLWLVVISAGIGLVSGIVPAFRAANLSVIDGLRRVV